jgi:hypothetical protein
MRMGKRRVLPKIGAVIGGLAAAAFLVSHVNAWFFAPPEQGSHVERDFVAAGFTFTLEQRFAGALLEGLPKLAYALGFLGLVRILWLPWSESARAERALSRVGMLMLIGAALLLLYPIPASIAFSLLEPGEAGMFLLSVPTTTVVAVVGSLLFAAVVSRMNEYLRQASPL